MADEPKFWVESMRATKPHCWHSSGTRLRALVGPTLQAGFASLAPWRFPFGQRYSTGTPCLLRT